MGYVGDEKTEHYTTGGWLALLTGLGVGFEACGIAPPAAPTSNAALYPISDLNDP
jgi:hypothetical protein